MKTSFDLLVLLVFLFIGVTINAQMRNGGMNRFGRQTSAIPQAQSPPPEPEKLTAAEYVEKEMPKLIEVMELDPFEEAIVRSVLVSSVQKRMELKILNLDPQKMKEEVEKIKAKQDADLKAGLPEEKFQTYLELLDNPTKTTRKKKKAKRKKKAD
ncbi:MAG: hypothetical protein AAGF77_09780 [Bacteroidota bacterium]